jgi:hypothetical protein
LLLLSKLFLSWYSIVVREFLKVPGLRIDTLRSQSSVHFVLEKESVREMEDDEMSDERFLSFAAFAGILFLSLSGIYIGIGRFATLLLSF